VKGGHLPGTNTLIDVLYDGTFHILAFEFLTTPCRTLLMTCIVLSTAGFCVDFMNFY
jgi:hypothetical protein